MKLLNTILLSLITIFLVVFTSCQKENTLEKLEKDIPLIQNIQIRDSPDMKNDLLKFRDVKHFKNTYEQLNTLYDEDDQEFNTVAEALGLNSIHNKLSKDEFSNPDDRFMPFLSDPIMMAVVNEYYEFQIEDVLLTYINNDFILTSHINDSKTQNETRNMSKGAYLDIELLPKKSYPVRDDVIETLLGPWSQRYSLEEATKSLITNANRSCNGDFSEENTGWGWKQSGNEAISMRTSYYKNFWSSYEEAKVYGYSWNGSSWQKQDSNLNVTIDATRRNPNCVEWETENEPKSCNSCRDKRARVNSGISGQHNFVYHCDEDVTGTYKKQRSGITINYEESIDFDCSI